MPLVAQTARGVDQLRERGLFEPDRSASSLESPITITFDAVRHRVRAIGAGADGE